LHREKKSDNQNMLDEADKKWIAEKVGSLIRQGNSGLDSRTRWHSSEISDLRIGQREHGERLDRIEASLETLIEATNSIAQTVAMMSRKVDQLVDALLHPAGNGKSN
jgi:hypothetical protein